MDFFASLIGAAFINYRLARMLTMEDGMFDVFQRFRFWVGDHTTKDSGEQHWLDKGINCPLCIGFWIALPLSILLSGSFNLWNWLAITGIQTFIQKMERE